MKGSAKGGNQKENTDEENIEECPGQAEVSLRRTTRKRTAPKPFGNTVPSNEIPQGKRVGAKAKRAKVEKAKKEPKSKKEPKAKKDAKTKPAKEPKAKKPEKTPKEKSVPKPQVAKNTEQVEQKTPQPKTTAVFGDESNGSKTNPLPKISEKEKSPDSLPQENALGDGFVPTPPEVDQDASPINAQPDSNKENQPEDYDDFEEFMDQVKTEPVDDYEYQITMDATQTQVNEMIASIATAALQGLGNRRGTRQRTTRNQSEDSDPEFTEKQLLKNPRKNPVRKARGTGKKALTKRAPKGSKATLRKEALGKCEIQPFVSKLFEVLNDESFDSINWNSKGDHFIIEREAFDHQFLKLSKEEKAPIQTKEFPSFIRQLNLYGFRKRREETGSDPNHFSHYVHKDGFFMKNRPDLLVHILRSGSSREKEKQLEVGEARNKLIQERGIQEGMEPAHPLPDHMDMPPCEEFILPPGSYSQPQVQPINFATNSQPTVTQNQDHAPTPEERMRALQNNGYYQKSGSGQWLKLPDYDRVQQQNSMMRTGDWINTQPGTSAEQNGFQSPPPIQYDITNMSPTYTGQLNVPMPSMSPMPLPAGLRSPTNNQGTNFSNYGNPMPQSKTPTPIQGLSDIQAWLDEIPDKNPDNGATSFSNNGQKLNSMNSQNEPLNF